MDLSLDDLIRRLQGAESGPLLEAVEEIGRRLAEIEGAERRRGVEALCGLFYIDLFDRPDLEPAVTAAEMVLASAGTRIVPLVLGHMRGSDIKSHLHLARVLGRIGPASLKPLRDEIAGSEDPYTRAFCLYAIGKIDSPDLHEALPEVTASLIHPDREVRDTAARTLGKIVQTVPAADLTARRRGEIFLSLCRVVGDTEPVVRAKAVRSLGKMARHEYLDLEQRGQLEKLLVGLLGRGPDDAWDHAFIVRREAEEALGHVQRA